MSEIYELTAKTRTVSGKGDNRRIRRLEDKVPAIIYGGDKNPEMITLDHKRLMHALENEAFYSHILTLDVDGKKQKVVLKDLHRHPSRPKILHADFLRVSAKTKLTMNVPLHFKGEELAPGVKTEEGVVSHLLNEVEIRCLPNDLPEYIEVDVSKLALGEAIHLSQLKLPKGVELVALAQGADADQPVVSIHKAKIVEEEPAPKLETPEAPETTEGETEE